MAKKPIPQINVPIQTSNGSMELAWYLFLQWVAENAGKVDLSDYFTKEETEELLSAKANTDDLKTVAFTGDYDDLENKPSIPAPQVNSDWNATSGVAEILNKPTIPDISNLANKDLSNLTEIGKNIANWTHSVTNCVTQVPQDIQLELDISTGTLTVKTGSKTYVPNGVDIFDELVLENDLTYGTEGAFSGDTFIYIRSDSTRIDWTPVSTCVSGTTAPSGSCFFWNTTNNEIRYYTNGTASNVTASIPIAIVHKTNGTWDKIKQVFNGYGYFAQLEFVLPGVKGLIPAGRNPDGSAKSTLFVIDSVKVHDDIEYTARRMFLSSNGIGSWGVYDYCEQDVEPSSPSLHVNWFDTRENYIKAYDGSKWVIREQMFFGTLTKEINNNITNFEPKNVFRAIDVTDLQVLADNLGIEIGDINSALGSKANTSLSNLNATGKSKLGPSALTADGAFINSSTTAIKGSGHALVLLFPGGKAEVHFAARITAASSVTTDFQWGINRDILRSINSNIPVITPTGGTVLFLNSSWAFNDINGFGGELYGSNQFWLPARVYQATGTSGGWPPSTFSVNTFLYGVAFGTYSV